MPEDELAHVRAIRRAISDECDGDLDRVLDYYEEVQSRVRETDRFEFVEEPIRRVARSHESTA